MGQHLGRCQDANRHAGRFRRKRMLRTPGWQTLRQRDNVGDELVGGAGCGLSLPSSSAGKSEMFSATMV
jgi:hypothetical protein